MKLVAFVPTVDLEAAVRFYVGMLGLTEVDRNDFAAVLRAGDTTVRVTSSPPFDPQPFTMLGWQVEDISSEVARLTEAGVGFVRYDGMEQDDLGIWTAPGGDRVAWFQDPDGNLLSLDQPA